MSDPNEGLHILIVDDEASIRDLLQRMLSRLPAQIDVASEGQDALDLIRREDYDLIVCDLWMPGMNGPSLYAVVSQERPDLTQRIIFITGDNIGGGAAEFLAASGCLYLVKPFSMQMLLDTVNIALGGSPSAREVD